MRPTSEQSLNLGILGEVTESNSFEIFRCSDQIGNDVLWVIVDEAVQAGGNEATWRLSSVGSAVFDWIAATLKPWQ